MARPLAPRDWLRLSSLLLTTGALLLFSGATLAYGMDHRLSIGELIAAHATVVIGPAIFKLGYVMRLAALQKLQASRPPAAHAPQAHGLRVAHSPTRSCP